MESAKEEAKEQYNGIKKEGVKNNRDAMLAAIQQNQSPFIEAPSLPSFAPYFDAVLPKYMEVLTNIGGQVYIVDNYEAIASQLRIDFANVKRIVSFDKKLSDIAEIQDGTYTTHQFADVDVCIATSSLAVAENSAVWISDNDMPERVLPFISQSLVVIIKEENIVATMHQAYDVIADKDYGFATFIAGPSKTADIEQSLVLGAHGPKTMTVFIIQKEK